MNNNISVNNKFFRNNQGIGLIELIIYIAIFGVVSMVLVSLFNNVIRSKAAADAKIEVNQNLRFVIDRITKEVQKSTSNPIVSVCSNGLNTLTVSGGVFLVTGDILQLGTNDLTSSKVKVVDPGGGDCLFTLIDSASPVKKTVKINLKIDYNDLGRLYLKYSNSIKTTVSLR